MKKQRRSLNELRNPINPKIISLPSLNKLNRLINEIIIGQEDIVQALTTQIYKGIFFPDLKKNILLMGKSGTGKTEIVTQLAKNINFHCIIEDATNYVDSGEPGKNFATMISNFMQHVNGNMQLVSRGIIFIDNVDKVIFDKQQVTNFMGRSPFYTGVEELSRIVQGTELVSQISAYFNNEPERKIIKRIDTSGITFILCGDFENTIAARKKRLNKEQIGFGKSNICEKISNAYRASITKKEQLIKLGFPVKLANSISCVLETRELEVEDFEKIIKHSKNSEFLKYKKNIESLGIELVYSDNLLVSIVKKAYQNSKSVGELNLLISYIFEKIMYDILGGKVIGKYNACILGDEIFNDNTKYCWK